MRLVLVRPGRPDDLILASSFSVVCGLAALVAPQTPGLWLFSLVSVFFLPGYCVLSIIAPGKGFLAKGGEPSAISTLERFVASIVLSIALIAIISTALSWSDWGLTTTSAVLEVSGITVLASIVGYARRSKLPLQEQLAVSISIRNPFKALNRWERTITVLVVLILASSTVIALTANMSSAEPYAQLTLTGASGTLSDLPQTAAVNENLTVRVTILNKMNKDLVYNLTVGIEGPQGFTSYRTLDWFSTNTFATGEGFVSNISIANGHSYSANLAFKIPAAGTSELLFLLNGESVFRDAWLFITVT